MNGGSRSEESRDDASGVVVTGLQALRDEPQRVRDQSTRLRSCIDPVWQFVIRSRPHAVTPNPVSKATAPAVPVAGLRGRLHWAASGVLIMPEGPMEWELVHSVCAGGRRSSWPASSPRQVEAIRKLGLQAIEVEPSEAAIAERITLALIEAVANDQLEAGAAWSWPIRASRPRPSTR